MADYDRIYQKILHARDVLSRTISPTALVRSSTFSRLAGGEVYLKLENLQKTGSFKVRGATYAISQLTDEQKRWGVIAASAGNHAQGVAFAASSLGVSSTVVMPMFTPIAKVKATQSYGAEVILHGDTFDEALARAREIAEEKHLTFMHPFNDENVIAGQGTIGLEILEDVPDVEMVAVPVGGGGLASGVAIAIKHSRPDVSIVGVQSSGAPSLKTSFERGTPTLLDGIDTICDGIAVKKPGDLTFEITRNLLDSVVTVDDLEVTRTMFLLLERAKLVAEPAGSVGLAALVHQKVDLRGRKAVAVISGGNVNMSFLAECVQKELFRTGRLVRVRGQLQDRPGSLNRVLECVAEARTSVIDIEHDRSDPDVPPNRAEVIMVLEVPDTSTLERLMSQLEARGMHFEPYED
ncbi:MAG: threonine ammonia-lyase [Candidatus Thorarchaeota archaeon]